MPPKKTTSAVPKGKAKSSEPLDPTTDSVGTTTTATSVTLKPAQAGDDRPAAVESAANATEVPVAGARTYRPVFTSKESGFELGENFRFKAAAIHLQRSSKRSDAGEVEGARLRLPPCRASLDHSR